MNSTGASVHALFICGALESTLGFGKASFVIIGGQEWPLGTAHSGKSTGE